MASELAPDMERGFITNGINASNVWNTEIQSVSCERKDGGDEWSHLSHECRFEHVLFNASVDGDGLPIFAGKRPFKFLTFSKDNVYYQIPSIDGAVDALIFSSFQSIDVGGALIPVPSRGEGWDCKVTCEMRRVDRLEFDRVHTMTAAGEVSPRNIFVHVDFDNHGTGVDLYFPCRYMNYSHPQLRQWKYMQTISGDVLMPFGNSYIYGSIVVAENQKGVQKIEFISPRYAPLGEAAGSMSAHYVRTFDFSFTVSGSASYYTYRS
ncbi:MAG: hypothetical protein ACTSV1_07845 [Alphaproteobacteria bacterium]